MYFNKPFIFYFVAGKSDVYLTEHLNIRKNASCYGISLPLYATLLSLSQVRARINFFEHHSKIYKNKMNFS